MHNMPTDFLATCVETLAVLQGFSILLTGLETAPKKIEGQSTSMAHDGATFKEFEETRSETPLVGGIFEPSCK